MERQRYSPRQRLWNRSHRDAGCFSGNDLVRYEGGSVRRGLGRLESGRSGGISASDGESQGSVIKPKCEPARPLRHRVISEPAAQRHLTTSSTCSACRSNEAKDRPLAAETPLTRRAAPMSL